MKFEYLKLWFLPALRQRCAGISHRRVCLCVCLSVSLCVCHTAVL